MDLEGFDGTIEDQWVAKYAHYLVHERNCSPHTLRNYVRDVASFAQWAESSGPEFWRSVGTEWR